MLLSKKQLGIRGERLRVLNKLEIKTEIEYRAHVFKVWTIGITNNPKRSKNGHDNPQIWYHWKANSESVVRSIAKHFIGKGVKRASGGGEKPRYVYLFL